MSSNSLYNSWQGAKSGGIANALEFSVMKRNAEKTPIEVEDQDGAGATEAHRQVNGTTARGRDNQTRPEIAVLGWDARSYRLSLRQVKV